jgi:hypothetical protein
VGRTSENPKNGIVTEAWKPEATTTTAPRVLVSARRSHHCEM